MPQGASSAPATLCIPPTNPSEESIMITTLITNVVSQEHGS